MAVFRYPLKHPSSGFKDDEGLVEQPTEAVDYLMLRRERYKYEDKNVPAFYSRKVPGNSAKSKEHQDRCYIAMMQGGDDFTKMAEALQDGAKAAIPEFSTAAVLSMINATNQFVGLQGQLDLNSIKNLQSGQIFNPYSEQIFQGVGFRTHNFAFKFFARSREESKEIR